MTKKDLKAGYVVEVEKKDGRTGLCLVLPNEDDKLGLSGSFTWCNLDEFNDDLVDKEHWDGRKITKVYGYTSNMRAYKLEVDRRELLWERPTYYNGKVVCVRKANHFVTVGKIYEFKDGKSVDDCGSAFPLIDKVESVEHLNKLIWSDFIEVVE